MKGVPVKFRAKTEKGDFVFGDLIQGRYIECASKIKPMGKRAVYVDKNSVAQLVGYDANGNEVYEGDTLLDSGGNEIQAKLWAMGVNPIDADGLNNGCINFFLKKEE